MHSLLMHDAPRDANARLVLAWPGGACGFRNRAAARLLAVGRSGVLSLADIVAPLAACLGMLPDQLQSVLGELADGSLLSIRAETVGACWHVMGLMVDDAGQARLHLRAQRLPAPQDEPPGRQIATQGMALLGRDAVGAAPVILAADAGMMQLLPPAEGGSDMMRRAARRLGAFNAACLCRALARGEAMDWQGNCADGALLRVRIAPSQSGRQASATSLLHIEQLCSEDEMLPQDRDQYGFAVDLDGRLCQVGTALATMLGRPALGGLRADQLLAPQGRWRCRAMLVPLLRGDVDVCRHTFPVLHGGGGLLWIEAQIQRDTEPGRRWRATARDVTRQFNHALLQSICGTALDSSASGVVVCDYLRPGLPIVYVNRGFERTTGYVAQQVLGRSCSLLQGPDTDQVAVAALRRELRQGRAVSATLLNVRSDGSTFWNYLEITPIREPRSGVVTHFLGLQHDVTARRELERRSQQRDREMEFVLRSSPFGVVTASAEQQVRILSPEVTRLTGLAAEQHVGQPLAQLDAALASLCQPGTGRACLPEQGQHVVLSVQRAQQRFIEVRASYRGPETGKQVFFFRDVTQDLQLQFMKNRFLAEAAHEMRTPLGCITGYADLLLARDYPPSQARTMLEFLQASAHGMSRLLSKLLDLSRLEAQGAAALLMEPLPLDVAIVEALRVARPPADQRPIHLAGITDGVLVLAARDGLQQVLVNLIGNAFKYSGADAPISITVARAADGGVALAIADRGRGISEADQRKLFTRFFRAEPDGAVQGTGLGLAISKEIVKQMGGAIEVSSVLGAGSVFTLRLQSARPGA